MEAHFIADRAYLWSLLRTQPHLSIAHLAAACSRSWSWVKKWRTRLLEAPPDDRSVLYSRSRARKHPPPCISQRVVDRVLELRDQPPDHLQRIPGPRTLLYDLAHDPTLQDERIPRSTRTVWRILDRAGAIFRPRTPQHQPLLPAPPGVAWQLDFKDATTVVPDPDGKRQHVVEVLNVVDEGTSLLVFAQPRPDFTAETAIASAAELVQAHGVPHQITFDRDARFVGGGGHRDVPAAFIRFWHALGVRVVICPPHRPDKNAFVERYHKTYDQECLQRFHPTTLAEVEAVTEAFQQHYNAERPHQGRSCGNQPPLVAFPTLPPLPRPPTLVDPDGWIMALDGMIYARKVRKDTSVTIDDYRYYVNHELIGQDVTLRLDGGQRAFVIEHAKQVIKTVPIKGVGTGPVPFAQFVAQLCAEARGERAGRAQGFTQRSFVL